MNQYEKCKCKLYSAKIIDNYTFLYILYLSIFLENVMLPWDKNPWGLFGISVSIFIGLFHMIYEISTMKQEYGWIIFGFNLENPLWFMVPWLIAGIIFFFWLGWIIPRHKKRKKEFYRSAFSQPGE